MFRPRVIVLLLVLITLLAYLPTLNNGFLNFDDETYVSDNPQVQGGITWPGIQWAFTTFHFSNWHPLTWIAYMVDYQLFRHNPAGHHLINLLIHSANAGLLFLLLLRLTGGMWPSAFAAALFAWHPLHVESVAWIAELKDVASTFWGLLSLLAYVRYAAGAANDNVPAMTGPPGAAASPVTSHPPRFYWLALGAFAMSLMFKSMLVTLPFLMLLLDCWPLPRTRTVVRCLIEKLPFLMLAAGVSVLTILAQRKTAMASLADVSLSLRLENVVTAYAGYLWKTIWPTHLAVLYPLPGDIPGLKLTLAVLVLAAISLAVAFLSRRQSWLVVGWLWYLGTLVPVIGLVQVGSQSMADRYSYFPLIGIFFAVALTIRELVRRFQMPPAVVAGPAIVVLAVCLALTENQLRYWHDTQTMFTHALDVTTDNPLGHLVLGDSFQEQEQPARALMEYQRALLLKQDRPETYNSIGRILTGEGKAEEALPYFRAAVKLKPDAPVFHDSLGIALVELGRYDEAKREFSTAMMQDTNYVPARYQMGRALLKQGSGVEAVKYFREALRMEPNNLQMLIYIASVLAGDENPLVRNGTEACVLAQHAADLSANSQPLVLDTLAAAQAEAGRFENAVETEQRALDLVKTKGASDEVPAMQQRLALYQKHQPWRGSFLGNGMEK